MTSKSFQVVSLFSGAMGLDLGLISSGLNIAITQESDKKCINTIRSNGHEVVEGDIRQLIKDDTSCEFLLKAGKIDKGKVFAVVGGPPCQSFSIAGKRKGIEDSRGTLYKEFLHVVSMLRPRFFVMENVKGLVSTMNDSTSLLDCIIKQFRAIGYHVIYKVVDAVHYGAPQFRERLIIIGSRDNEEIFIPAPTHFHFHQNVSMRWRTLCDAINDIESDCGEHINFSAKVSNYLNMIPEGGNWKSLPKSIIKDAMGGAYLSRGGKAGFYRRLSYNEPSPTLVTSPVQKATALCHPRKTRPLSVKEYARIQQFPDTWKFEGSSNDCYRQIGNAVPIPLGKAIGEMLISVALGNSQIKVKRMKGTSVHK